MLPVRVTIPTIPPNGSAVASRAAGEMALGIEVKLTFYIPW
jgi:hypothetical protein